VITDINAIAVQCGNDSRAWFPDIAEDLDFMALAAAGEIGELCNVLKKVRRGTHTYEEMRDQIASESVDAIIYLLNILDIEGQDIAALYEMIREKNVVRFGIGSASSIS
jgi:NTP pyrophosphatase (non-canonical NTP hydrolase)